LVAMVEHPESQGNPPNATTIINPSDCDCHGRAWSFMDSMFASSSAIAVFFNSGAAGPEVSLYV
jgi:hypothetical protein